MGIALLLIVLWDSFETIVLPRRVRRRLRLTCLFYTITWRFWSAIARHMRLGDRRDGFLSYYGPLSLIMLLGVWATSLALGFAMLHWGLGSTLTELDREADGFRRRAVYERQHAVHTRHGRYHTALDRLRAP